MTRKRKRSITSRVARRMKKMRITEWSSMDTPTSEDYMGNLDEIERILKRRKVAAEKRA